MIKRALQKYRDGEISLAGAARMLDMDMHEFLYYLNELQKETVFTKH